MFNQQVFDAMPKFDTFTKWFIRLSDHEFLYGPAESFGKDTEPITENILSEANLTAIPEDVLVQFQEYQRRPEYEVGRKKNIITTNIASNSQDYMVDAFESTIVGAAFIRALNARRNPDTAFPAVTRFLDWIRSTDFYICPGSTRFHDSEPMGLLFHSLNVYNNIIDLKNLQKFKDVEYHSIALISLCHDFTKIGNYESYMKNVKNEQTQQWEKVPAYRWKCNPFPFGHGVASMYIVTQFFKLSIEEMLAIRWHMGEYRVADADGGELEEACEKYPMVRMIQFADQLACVQY